MSEERKEKARVGIIGAGIAGSFTAFFLKEAFGDQVDLIIFEKEERVGGRVNEAHFRGLTFEAGASLIHSANRYIGRAVDRFGLHRTGSVKGEKKAPIRARLGIWNGSSFDIRMTMRPMPMVIRLLSRYGFGLFKAKKLAEEAVTRLDRVYGDLERGHGYLTPEEMHKSLGLYEWAQEEAYTLFRKEGIGERLIVEWIDGVARANYVQGSEMNAWVTLISLVGAGLGGGYTYSVLEGNRRVCEELIRHSGAALLTGSAVVGMTREGNAYVITTQDGRSERCDAIIVATPLEAVPTPWDDGIIHSKFWRLRKYQENHVTLVAGQLSPAYFGLKDEKDLPHLVLTRNKEEIPFAAIGRMGVTEDGKEEIYKIFSTRPLDEMTLSRIFSRYSDVERWIWHAYPVLTPMKEWPPFRLGERLYYVNGMESAVSTMETEAIAAKNVVNLFRKEWAE